MSDQQRFKLIKPSLQTPFHVDFQWWKSNDRNWRVYLHSLLCPEHQNMFANLTEEHQIDWVDPVTAEVQQLDGIQHALIHHCARQEGFLSEHTALVDAVFRLFLINGNHPLSSEELGAKLNRPPETILRTLAGPQVYRGLRPYAV